MDKSCPNCRLINSKFAERCDCGYDFTSGGLEGADAHRLAPEPLPALPRVWVGYLFAATLLILWDWGLDPTPVEEFSPYLFVVALAGWAYWFYCVSRFHVVLRAATNKQYPIHPSSAVGYHFIPIYNFYWLFKWPNEIARFIEARRPGKRIRGAVGLLLLSGFLLARVDLGLGMIIVFSTGIHLKRSIDAALHPGSAAEKKRSRWAHIGIGCGTLVVFSAAVLIVLVSFLPENVVIPGSDLNAEYVSVAEQLGLVDPNEEILFWYSDGLFSVKEGLYFFTNRKVVVYRQSYDEPAVIVSYPEIEDIDFTRNSSVFEDSVITLSLRDGTVVFPVSSENDGDLRFIELLKETWEQRQLSGQG